MPDTNGLMTCPHCEVRIDPRIVFGMAIVPAGSVGICLTCGQFSTVSACQQLRKMSDVEIGALPDFMRRDQTAVQNAMRERHLDQDSRNDFPDGALFDIPATAGAGHGGS